MLIKTKARFCLVLALAPTFASGKMLRDLRITVDSPHETTGQTLPRNKRRLISLITVGNNGEPAEVYPLGRCQGDCDSDDDCEVGLVCFNRDAQETVPGCYGDGNYGLDYCYDPNVTISESSTGSSSTLTIYADAGTPADAYPLGRCEGDCDSDADCADGLVCMTRTGFEEIPGCRGTGIFQKDYCYDPNQTEPASPSPTSLPTPLGPTNAPVPATPVPSAQPSISSNPTGTPTLLPDLQIVGDEGNPTSDFPLGKCEGDCDEDEDCADGLYCFLRKGDEEVPGCGGSGDSGKDYCFYYMDYPTNNNGGGPAFRLKLWWQEGYYWQEDPTEKKWCLECDVECILKKCDEDSTRFELIANGDLGAQLKIAESDNCLEQVRERAIETRTCEEENHKQYFKGAFNQINFEIRPYNQTDKCLTNHHHPRDKEVVYAEDCTLARAGISSLWIKY